ncbi:helix-turn-helix transcriptional regulator [Antarcticirhabdus aurantiaca]|uniref:PAS domain S-box protein n=1 Tax=Antarcticirhabdus aurantiaca TaxID=2606717 RepID=A0ACD4NRR2_9HYPH|nr:PAS domain S-box protein [Jeongeuplla avenae]
MRQQGQRGTCRLAEVEVPSMQESSPIPELRHRQLQQLITGLDDGVVLVGFDRVILWANERALALHGVKHLDELGSTIEEYRKRFQLTYRNKQPVHREDFPIERAMKGETPRAVTIEVSPVHQPDNPWTHTIRCFVIYDEAGDPEYMVLVIDDETGRFEAEDRFESAFNANPAPALICRLSDLRYVRVNRGFLEMTGFSRDDVVGRSAVELDVFAGSADRDAAVRNLHEGRTVPQTEADLRVANGAGKRVIVAGQPIEISDERCMLFTFADLEPRRRAERALEASEERFAKAFGLSPVASWIWDAADFRFIEANTALVRLTGYAKEQIVGRTPLDLRLWADPLEQRKLGALLEGEGSISGADIRIRVRDGSPVDCLLSAETIDLDGRKCVLCVMQDITERKRSEAELMTAIETVMSETSWFSRTIVEKLAALRSATQHAPSAAGTECLTEKELGVLKLVCEGLSDAEIAERLRLSRHTVRNHLSSVFRKIGVKRRGAAMVWARERGVAGSAAQ